MSKYTPSFLRFYAVYPKKKGKFEANRSWVKLKLDKIEKQIINHVELSIKYDTDWKLGRIPYASTYINQRRWEDEISGCYHKPDTNKCVAVEKLPRKEPDSLKIREIQNKINVEGWRIAKLRSWHNPEEQALLANLSKQLEVAKTDAVKLGDIINE